jgi:hypothetical protein
MSSFILAAECFLEMYNDSVIVPFFLVVPVLFVVRLYPHKFITAVYLLHMVTSIVIAVIDWSHTITG